MVWKDETANGILFLVVGPSGVGKDTLIDVAAEQLTPTGHFHFAQRTITRPASAGGEAHEPVDAATFEALIEEGAFAVHWRAHGTAYGIRLAALEPLYQSVNVVVNASRTAIDRFAAIAAHTAVISVTAPPDLVRARLAARGREDADSIAARLARRVEYRADVPLIEIVNDRAPQDGGRRMVEALKAAA
ncbi:MAG: phosphonate metabolism protein/1,5-bisphosphokinase (PRPP-forming) PhnN [Pseudomonadota bacterium]